jgi:molecular chaperone DnaK (HSP70)
VPPNLERNERDEIVYQIDGKFILPHEVACWNLKRLRSAAEFRLGYPVKYCVVAGTRARRSTLCAACFLLSP